MAKKISVFWNGTLFSPAKVNRHQPPSSGWNSNLSRNLHEESINQRRFVLFSWHFVFDPEN
jgi:hypothetical protein